MRRTVLIPVVIGLVALSPSAQAAPSWQLADREADWLVPSQDVVAGRLSSVRVAGKPVLRGELKLAFAPWPGVATTYWFGFGIGCRGYGFNYTWPGAAEAATATLAYTDFCRERETTEINADKEYPVTVRIKDKTIVWETPYVGHIRKGVRVTGFGALACSRVCGVMASGTDAPFVEVWSGDFAQSNARYVVGSDLPRK
jgi:hypothetical protein